ncbi:MAG: MBL fold metallo-hydrolase [Acidobacteria bacterium]|nr:MBL fold metallo-hydrolase [Acidobacteriota bacterium]
MQRGTKAVSIIVSRGPNSREVLLVKRDSRLPFLGGYLAFPAGGLEDEDRETGQLYLSTHSPESEPADYHAFVAAAARELFEETGVWLAKGKALSREKLRDYRRQILSHQTLFSEVLKREDQRLDSRDLTPIFRITTPQFILKYYDTWFLHCHIPAGEEVEIWPGELEEGYFITPEEILERWRQGTVLIAPVVLLLLHELATRDCESFLPPARQLGESLNRGQLQHIYFSSGVLLAPLRTPTKPPSTHTNAYLVGEKKLYLIDPATPDPSEQEKLWELLDELLAQGKGIEGILLTHHHPDHVGAVTQCQKRYQLPVYAHRLTAGYLPDIEFAGYLEHGQELELGFSPDSRPDWKLRIYHLPGHAPGHLVFQETRYQALIAGDLISTISSILIDPTDGHLGTYIKSLQFLESVADGHLYPAHGPPAREGRKVIQKALGHRRKRKQHILQALEANPQALQKLLQKIYSKLDRKLMGFAESSLLSSLQQLVEEEQVEETREGYRLTDSTGELA